MNYSYLALHGRISRLIESKLDTQLSSGLWILNRHDNLSRR